MTGLHHAPCAMRHLALFVIIMAEAATVRSGSGMKCGSWLSSMAPMVYVRGRPDAVSDSVGLTVLCC